MKNTIKPGIFLSLFLFSVSAFADLPGASSANDLVATLEAAMKPAIVALTKVAISWLVAFSGLQLFITNYSVLKNGGEIDSAILKTAGGIAWIAVCMYIINNAPEFIASVGDSLFGILGIKLPDASSILLAVIGTGAAIGALSIAVGVFSDAGANILVYLMLAVLAAGIFVAFKIFMLHLELALIVTLSPLSFALLGLNALKDQGIAPFKSLLSLAYRIILLTIILSTFAAVGNTVKDAITAITPANIVDGVGDAITAILSAFCGYLLLAFLVWKSDSIAASLASGSTSLGTGDIASAAAAGAAAGSAVAAMGQVAAGKSPLPIPSLVSNASSKGSGPRSGTSGDTGLNSPLMSKPGPTGGGDGGGGDGGGGGAPTDPDLGTMKTATAEQRHEALTGESPNAVAANKGASAALGAASEGATLTVADAAKKSASSGQSPADVGSAVLGAGGTQAQAMAAAGNMAAGDADGGHRGLQGGQLDAGVSKMKSGGSAGEASAAMQAAGATPRQAQRAAAAMAEVRDGPQSVANAVPDSPKRPGGDGAATSPTSASNSESGEHSSIGGNPYDRMEQAIEKLADRIDFQNTPKKPSLEEKFGNANQQVARETASTSVSISTHQID